MEQKNTSKINVRSYITSIGVIFLLMVLSFVLTMVIPSGEYNRILDESGNSVVDTESYHEVEGNLPFWKWLLSPILVLTVDGSATIIGILAFLLVIGAIFNALTDCNLMSYMLARLVNKFKGSRYKLLFIVPLLFMTMGSVIGSFEEVVPLVPIFTGLAVGLGWDVLVGIGMSLVAVGCGFAAGVINPFTIGLAQAQAGVPVFSGFWFRLICFVFIYGLLVLFLYSYAKKIEKPISIENDNFQIDQKMDKALFAFLIILGIGIVIILLSSVITILQDYTMIILAIMFLIAGLVSTNIAGLKGKKLGTALLNGVIGICPSVILILFASSIKYILTEGKVLDTILHGAVNVANDVPKWLLILFVYLIVLFFNFFIASGSAKVFLLIPFIAEFGSIFGLSMNLAIVAFAFGDGFSNVFYPTNPVLLITLGVSDISYGKYIKWSWKFHLANFILTCGLLLFGYVINFQ